MAGRKSIQQSVKAEFAGAELGDERLSYRLVELAQRVGRQPEASFPQAADSEAELEATYRFLNNERVTPDAILAPHVRQTLQRCARVSRLVVAHDTTELNYGKAQRQDLGRVGRGQSFGFYGHFALAIDANASRVPLGLLGFVVHRRSGSKNKGRRSTREIEADPTNERRRWRDLTDSVNRTLAGRDAVHVMDREGDTYVLLSHLVHSGSHFVVRMMRDQRELASADHERVQDTFDRAQVMAERSVPVSARGKNLLPSYRKAFPERRERIATLQVSAKEVVIKKPISVQSVSEPTLSLRYVRVFEPEPPAGETPIEWRLWTSEAIDTPEQVLAVVDAYRCRWRIEEYFKALKTGCRIEARQLETFAGLVNTVALFGPLAWRLLALKTLAQTEPDRPAADVLSSLQISCLNAALEHRGRKPLPKKPSVRDAMLGLAALGGHLPRNGDPGWIVLGRGLDDLLNIEFGFVLARKM